MNYQFLKTAFLSTVAVLLFQPQVTLSQTSTQQSVGVLMQAQETPTCYIQRSDGTVKDLTKLCGLRKPSSCNQNLGSADRNKVLSEFCQRNERCELKGTCSTPPPAPYGPPPGTAAG
jgi:hypothetical protein